MFDTKIKLRKELLEKAKSAASEMGCSSVEEFVETVLERELERIENSKKEEAVVSEKQKEIEDITTKLKGLGYLE